MDKKLNSIHFRFIFLGLFIFLVIILLFLGFKNSQTIKVPINSEVPVAQVDENPNGTVYTPKETPSLIQKKITGMVVSIEGSVMNVSIKDAVNNDKEQLIKVEVNEKTKFILRKLKNQDDFRKEMQVFMSDASPDLEKNFEKIKEVAPKPYVEEEVSISEINIKDLVAIITEEEITKDTISAVALSVTVDVK